MSGAAYKLDEVAVRLDGGAGGTDVPLPVSVVNGGTGADQSTIAKGGLLVGTAAGTIGIKAVGANDQVLTADSTAAGGVKWAAGGGISGLTTNYLTKATAATTIGNTALVEASAGALATTAGTALGLTATAPAATTGASQAGVGVTITASPAVASTDTAGAAVGGAVTITSGDATRLTSGAATGGNIRLALGAGIGGGAAGLVGGTGATTTGVRFSPDTGNAAWVQTWTASGGWSGTMGNGVFTVRSTGEYGMSSGTTVSNTNDTLWRRRAAANPAWGVAHDSAPVAYVHSLAADASAGSGTSNVRGARATVTPGNGKGTGGSGAFVAQTAYPGASGTTANTMTDRLVLESVWTTLTDSADTAFAKISFGASSAVGVELFVTVEANDGTDYQVRVHRLRIASVRAAAGNTVSGIDAVGTPLTAASAGTLTATFDLVEGADGVTVRANPVSSLTATTLRISYQAFVNGPATVGAP